MLQIKPMEPILTNNIPQGENWVHEIKFDGVRGILVYSHGTIDVYSKKGNNITTKFPEILSFKDIFKGQSAIIDGELTVWNHNKHSFHDILVRVRSSSQQKIKSNIINYPLTYAMFDILEYNGKDLKQIPLLERKQILKNSFEQSNSFIFSDYYKDGSSLYEKAKSLGYEGIVSKDISSTYIPQKKHELWYKIKVKKKLLAVVGGLNIENTTIKSLVLGIYKDNELYYIGNASIGLSQNDLLILKNNLSTLQISSNPFVNLSPSKTTVFTKPILTCWVEYLEWTNSGRLRHPQIMGFSDLPANNANGVEYTIEEH